jgi:hypothetical protein
MNPLKKDSSTPGLSLGLIDGIKGKIFNWNLRKLKMTNDLDGNICF